MSSVQSELNDNVDKPKFRISKQNKCYWNMELGDLCLNMRNAEYLFLNGKITD